MASHVPAHVFIRHCLPALSSGQVRNLQLVSREFRDELRAVNKELVASVIQNEFPPALLKAEAANIRSFANDPDPTLSIPRLCRVLQDLPAVQQRRPGQRYSHLLAPLADHSIFRPSSDIKDFFRTAGLLMAVYAHARDNYRMGSQPFAHTNIPRWFMYMVHDYLYSTLVTGGGLQRWRDAPGGHDLPSLMRIIRRKAVDALTDLGKKAYKDFHRQHHEKTVRLLTLVAASWELEPIL